MKLFYIDPSWTEEEKENARAMDGGMFLLAVALITAIGCMIFGEGCAAVVEDNRPNIVLSPGIRDWCGMPPKFVEGTAKRFTETCMHYESQGPATCGYITRVDHARSWACDIVLWQDECGSEWYMKQMDCVPWIEGYIQLIPHPAYEDVNE